MSGETILIVDDNPLNRKLEKVILEVEDYLVRTAQDAREALSVMQNFLPELILLDLQLPGMDGIEFTKQLKATDKYKNIPILIVTSYGLKSEEERARAAGCSDYIRKPIDTKALPVIVGSYLRKGTGSLSAGL